MTSSGEAHHQPPTSSQLLLQAALGWREATDDRKKAMVSFASARRLGAAALVVGVARAWLQQPAPPTARRVVTRRGGLNGRRIAVTAAAGYDSTESAAAAASKNLAGTRVLVTGASGGIGAGIAVALGARGCRLILHYNTREAGVRKTAERVAEAGGIVDGAVRADFRSDEALEGVWETVDTIWPDGPDALINNAGVVTKRAATSGSYAAFDETMAINAVAPYKLACAAKERGAKDVIMISSIHGQQSVEWMSAYAASKATLDSLTRTLAVEWAPDGVRVNGVAPGVVPVERTEALLSTDDAQALWRPHLPTGAMGAVEHVADACVWLLASPARQWLAGHTVRLDGGMLARANMPIRPRPPEVDLPAVETAVASRLDDLVSGVSADANTVAAPVDKQTDAAVPATADQAREAAKAASAAFGPTSPQAAAAWSLVDDFERRDESRVPTTLADECEIDSTSEKCRKLAQDLQELDALIAAGPGQSSLRQAARRMMREIEDSYDNRPFDKK